MIMEQTFVDKQKTITLVNKTNTKLHIKNKRKASCGPDKGKWALYAEDKLTPGAETTTKCFETHEHQLSVHTATSHGPDMFLYTIQAFDLEDGNTVELHDQNYKIM